MLIAAVFASLIYNAVIAAVLQEVCDYIRDRGPSMGCAVVQIVLQPLQPILNRNAVLIPHIRLGIVCVVPAHVCIVHIRLQIINKGLIQLAGVVRIGNIQISLIHLFFPVVRVVVLGMINTHRF